MHEFFIDLKVRNNSKFNRYVLITRRIKTTVTIISIKLFYL